jgi:hypothetical protein
MDKTGMYTGPGRIKERVDQTKPNLIGTIDLFNYNIDGNVLKPEHEDYLRRKIVKLLKGAEVHVKLTGVASRTGDRAYNMQLSTERVLRVKRFLIDQGLPESKVPGQEMRAVGEETSHSPHDEDEWERRVSVTIAWGVKSRPLPMPWQEVPETVIIEPGKTDPEPADPGPPSKPESRDWKIKHLGSAEGGIVGFVGAGAHLFWIVDKTNGTEVVCALEAGSVGGPGTPVSITAKGPWNHFTTTDPHHIGDFGSFAWFDSPPGAGPWSLGKTTLTVVGISSPPIEIQTGFTFGAGTGSRAAGPIVCSDPKPYVPRFTWEPITGTWIED